MYERKIPILNCGLDLVAEILYGKWKIRLLYFINEGYKRPSELQRRIPEASHRVLFMQLKELEEHGLVTKVIYPEVPPRVEYGLTELAQSLMPVLQQLGQWGDAHQDQLLQQIMKRYEQPS
ncbi:helix-turn-helix transcriptional regulator [Chitinophaga agrisoli]|uniref:Helix-turn-helix transcriptional regulator n=1 Tax=Chitinophaga agrisoli TaxID=2607653 RepID=A0A5B2VLZ6_9BACT|nr:helix-turn-helix domain-containing protein [Chitinophaga agrisoli]KAA2239935.1 helix-turn-helix transcriptional regulator [Chitinophaga agrisoli]